MVRLVLLITIIAIGLIVWNKFNEANEQQRKKLVLTTIVWGVLGGLALLALTGHLNAITAVIGGAIAMLTRAVPNLLKYIPTLTHFYKQTQTNQASGNGAGQQGKAQTNNSTMSQEEALDILGLKPGATREDIISAHKRMMQKVHPDRGGSDYLAAQLNKAKKTLLG
jgi:predicted lipid-binding transport protein (Tim44 family)